MIELHFLGQPAPQGSKISTRWGGMREASKKIEPWRASVQYACSEQYKDEPIKGPVSLDVTFFLPRAKNHWSTAKGKEGHLVPSAPVHHTITPDIDKMLRGLLDPMTVRCGGNVLIDDSQIVEVRCRKLYAEPNQCSGALVRISLMD